MNPFSSAPIGWRLLRLGQVAQIIAGQSPPSTAYRTEPEGLPFFQGKADFGLMNPIARVWCVEPRKIAREGDILVSVRAPVGPTNVADVECCIGRGLAAIRPLPDFDRDFLLLALRAAGDHLASLGSGSTFTAIGRADLEKLMIPFPPLEEQRRIASRSQRGISIIQCARVAAEARLEAARALHQALLEQTLADARRLTAARLPLSEVCSIESRQVDPRDPSYSGLPHVSGENIESVTGEFLTVRTAAEDRMISGKYLFEAGDVLYSKIRPYLRKVAVTNFRGVCSADIYPLRARPDRVLPAFLAAELLSVRFTRYSSTQSGRARMPKLNREQLMKWQVGIPSLADQARIVNLLQNGSRGASKVRDRAELELASIVALPGAFIRGAFRGEI